MTGPSADYYAEQARAEAELTGELFTAEDEFPGSSPSPSRPIDTLPDVSEYWPEH